MHNIQQLVLATSNAGKLREFTALFRPLQIEIIPQSAFDISDADETGLSFIENAIIKARHASAASGLPALADDSGLAVDALGGAPGIYSARYAGVHCTADECIQKLLAELSGVAETDRKAAFHCVLALVRNATDPTPIICDGIWQGRILHEKRGEFGFGYDPVFFVPSENKSAAELPPDIKNKMSHRSKAMAMLAQILNQP